MNSPIKRPYQESEYTPENILELKKCAQDPVYFIENYVKVQHPTRGTVPMVLYEYQKDMLNAIHTKKDVIILASRQLGKCLSGYTLINTIRKPTGFRKALLKILDKKLYDSIFK